MIKDKWKLLLFFVIVIITSIYFRRYISLMTYPLGSDAFTWITPYSFGGEILPYVLTDVYKPSYVNPLFSGIIQTILKMAYMIYDNPIITKIFVILLYMLAAFGIYKFVKDETDHQAGAFFASVFYVVNIRIFDILSEGHYGILIVYAFVPLLFYYTNRILRSYVPIDIIILSILIVVIIQSHIPSAGIFLLFLVVFILFKIIFLGEIKKKIKCLLLLTGFTAGFLAYFYVPLLTLKFVESTKGLANWDFVDRWSLSPSGAIILTQGEWVDRSFYPYYPYPSMILFQILIVSFIWLGVLLSREKNAYVFGGCSLVSILLSTGLYPFGHETYISLTQNFPFFAIFRTVNRWQLFTVFAYSVMLAYSVRYLDLELKKRFRIKYKSIIFASFLILIFISIFAPFTDRIIEGAKTYEYPQSYLDAFTWINKKEGNFNVLVLPYRVGWQWIGGKKGWFTHDFGQKSPMFTKKPVIGVNIMNRYSSDFFSLIEGELESPTSDQLGKLLSLANVRYIVVYNHTEQLSSWDYKVKAEKQRLSLMSQKGIKKVFDNEYSSVYEIENWNDTFINPTKSLMVVGGRESLLTLSEIKEVNFNEWIMFFSDQIIRENGEKTFVDLLHRSDAILFSNTEPIDIAMLTLDNATRISTMQYACPYTDSKTCWIGNDEFIRKGAAVLNSKTIMTTGENNITVPIKIDNDGKYEVWLRVVYNKNIGELSMNIDADNIGSVIPYSYDVDIRWVKLGEINLNNGEHIAIINNKRSIYGIKNDIDTIILAKSGSVKYELDKTIKMLENFDDKMTYFIDKGKFKSMIDNMTTIVDNNQTNFWQNVNPDYVKFSNSLDMSTTLKNNSFQIDIHKHNRTYFTLAENRFEHLEDWSNERGLSLWFKGNNTGTEFQVLIMYNKSYDNWAKYSFIDDSPSWKKVIFNKNDPMSSRGYVDWKKVWMIRIGNADKNITGRFYIDDLQLFGSEKIEANIPILKKGIFNISLMAKGDGIVTVETDSIHENRQINDIDRFFILKPQVFNKDDNNIKMTVVGNDDMQGIMINPYSAQSNNTTRSIINYTKVNPVKYKINVKTDKPIYLVFSDSYHPLWKARIGNEEIEPIITYSFVNGFFIQKTGEYEITLEFIGQNYVWMGSIISIMTFIIAVGYIFGNRERKIL